jgi:hypothetical protein
MNSPTANTSNLINPLIRWSHKFFVLSLMAWTCVFLANVLPWPQEEQVNAQESNSTRRSVDQIVGDPSVAKALGPPGDPGSERNPQTKSNQPWWQGPLETANGLATVVIAIATTVYAAYAAKQWRAIRDQSKIAQDALIADKRAIIFAPGFNQFWEHDPTTNLFHWRFRPILRNGGDTPTRKMRMYVNCEIRNTALPAGYSFSPHDSTAVDINIVEGMIPPKIDLQGGVVPRGAAVTPQDILDAQQGKKFIYVWGWVEYFDVFPNTPKHITRYCWIIIAVGDPMKFVPNTQGQPPTPGTLIFNNIHASEGNSIDEG